MNILICSVGRRVKLIQYFKEELHKVGGKVVAVDCDQTAAALHHADMFEIVPRIDHPDYIPYLKKLCEKYNIKGVLSLIDPELSLLAHVKEEFENDGIKIVVPDKRVVDICYDKYRTYEFLLANDIPPVPTYIDINDLKNDLNHKKIQFPLIIKPRNGSASIGIYKVNCIEELEPFKAEHQDYIFQPYMGREEFGADCYIDLLSKEATNVFLKRKLNMRAGETDKSIAIKDPMLKQVVERLIVALRPVGPIDIDFFRTENGYSVSEINPRFGGGYLHAHEMGQNFVENIINNIRGETNSIAGEYEEGSTMVKYDHVMVI
ncbi:MAG TPA: carbamoylphosphate synthase large subunit [Bacillus bacterium]|uniref:Carbamoyl phosphate synthase n=1 Tax=Siminovitchia fordii TaxID=254759 RepID=A0ABQ4K5D2_9BACI|nr:ATP-grasp domain-containing protein [Siminovitchia fordii]GIN20934.1 carbamoyl phosphate synthase [Siminovitchia fordii]HBZ12100.1 carbamoylphosphate synthase large subunit [Bacillus sp. (in: firmicutes)]